MSIDELVADVLTNYAVAWQSSDGAECFGIAMELFNLIEQHVEAEMAWRDAEIERLRKALHRLACLGNGDRPGSSDGNQIALEALASVVAKP